MQTRQAAYQRRRHTATAEQRARQRHQWAQDDRTERDANRSLWRFMWGTIATILLVWVVISSLLGLPLPQ